ncbi:hypothetical protein RUND412_007725 [Rhizina undulata]
MEASHAEEKALPDPPTLIFPPRKPLPVVSKESVNPNLPPISDADSESAKPLPLLPTDAAGATRLPKWIVKWLPEATYFGVRRESFLALVLGAISLLVMVVLVVAIGVSVGRRSGKKGGGYVPLPTSGDIFTGDGTYYNPALGACGINSTDTDFVGAVSWIVFDKAQVGGNPNNNPLCGRKVRVSRFRSELSTPVNASVEVTIVDRCTGCNATAIDLSPVAFDQIAEQVLGRVLVSWAWINE